jgi:hypothetical protein
LAVPKLIGIDMGTEIRTWQIDQGSLKPINSKLKDNGRTEPYDLEPWIQSNPEILSLDISIIGRQVTSKSGPIDLLAIDSSGNLVVIELKRDRLPREALAQAIDYASDVATWSVGKISEVCTSNTGKTLEEIFEEQFPDIELESININSTQRILLVGFSIEASLERMIEWLSDGYSVNINAIVLSYIKTFGGDEILMRTSIISEELEQERVKKKKKFEIPMSDEPGSYEDNELYEKLKIYLSRSSKTNQRIREVLFPACLNQPLVTREDLKKRYLEYDPSADESKVGYYLTPISSQLGMKKNDFLRQIIRYEYPRNSWEKDNFQIDEKYRKIAETLLSELSK